MINLIYVSLFWDGRHHDHRDWHLARGSGYGEASYALLDMSSSTAL